MQPRMRHQDRRCSRQSIWRPRASSRAWSPQPGFPLPTDLGAGPAVSPGLRCVVGYEQRREEEEARQQQNTQRREDAPVRLDHVVDQHAGQRPADAQQQPGAAAAALHVRRDLGAEERRLLLRLLERQQPGSAQLRLGLRAPRLGFARRRQLLGLGAVFLLLRRGGDGLVGRRLLLLLETDGWRLVQGGGCVGAPADRRAPVGSVGRGVAAARKMYGRGPPPVQLSAVVPARRVRPAVY